MKTQEGPERPAPVDLLKPAYFFNRELSWLKFNERVLEEANDPSHPLLERLKFLAIFNNNLDEFFMIRVAGLKEQINANIVQRKADGLSPEEQLLEINRMLVPMLEEHSRIMKQELAPGLKKHKIYFKTFDALRQQQKDYLEASFEQKLFPILTPLAFDSAHPMPKLRGLGINLLVELQEPFDRAEPKLAFVPIPISINRFFVFRNDPGYDVVAIEEVISRFIGSLFPNMVITNVSTFRLTRNADLEISEDEADDLLKYIERELRKRRLGTIIRLELDKRMKEENKEFLRNLFQLEPEDVYQYDGYLASSHFFQLMGEIDVKELKDPPFAPALNRHVLKSPDIFTAIRQKDILLYHPYDSFNPVVEMIQSAAHDPQVLAIKMTLYRTSGDSPVIRALKEAAENGKQVTTLIELKARFDEESNIHRAREMEQSGINVVYGMLGLKTHCKTLLILREEQDGIAPYMHLGTGNYNEKTAKLYTDVSYLTCNRELGADVAELFNVLTGYSRQEDWRQIYVAPINMRERFKYLIDECIKHHSKERPSRIRVVVNSLVDPGLILALYEASRNGVKVELIVRGICCLAPGIKGVSENIVVKSIVGRFLEHQRIYVFEYNAKTLAYFGSADWMQRNLNRRIEVIIPVLDPDVKQQLLTIVNALGRDNLKARFLQPDGSYVKKMPDEGVQGFSAQQYFMDIARRKQKFTDTTNAV